MDEAAAFAGVADAVLSDSTVPVELVWRRRRGGLTRFANNGVHQHSEVAAQQCIVRVCAGGRCGVAVSGSWQKDSVDAAVRRATALAAYGPEAPGGLASPVSKYPTLDNYIEATARMGAAERVEGIRPFVEDASRRSLTAAGAFSTETVEVGVANSSGVRAEHTWTDATFSVTLMASDGRSAWGETSALDAGCLRLDALRAELFGSLDRSPHLEPLPPGRYTVVLRPAAVAEMLQFLAWLGFGARQVLDGTSFMAGKSGASITGDMVTIVDDPLRADAPGMPFDFEGSPRQRVTLIDRGIAREPVSDVATATELHTHSTGHALPQPNAHGPLPINLTMLPGDSESDALIAGVEHGVLITRFWYTRVVDPARTRVTGLTRDGTFLIRQGSVGPRVREFRFNESILDALRRVRGIGSRLERVGRSFAPSLVIGEFNLSQLAGGA